MNFCGSVLQRRGGWQGGASLKGQRAPGPSGSFRFLAEFAIEEGQKSFILAILSSTAAGLPCSFYLASTSGCKEKGPTRHGTGFASGVYLGLLSVLSGTLSLPSQTGAPRAGRLFPSVTNSPGCRAPMGLACSTFVSVDKMPEPMEVFPLVLLWGDCLCTPQGVVGADKYIYQYWETWWNCCR